MKRTLLTYGLISGLFCSLLMVGILPFENKIGFDHSYILGYTLIVLSFLLVFFGIRSYRDKEGNGHITFARAFGVGISITLITCIFYVVTWEIIYFNFMHDYMDKYAAYAIGKLKASGASAAVIQAQVEQMAKLKQNYENPLYNAMLAFLEPFPVGLLITLISAAILRKKAKSDLQPAAAPSAASY
jgi:uncharacterized transporter YbjL